MNKIYSILFSFCILILNACSTHQDINDVGQISLALMNVPTDVQCLRIKAENSVRSVERDLTITNGVVNDINLEGLPTGDVTLSANAYDITCASVVTTTIPTWKSYPLSEVITIEEGVPYDWNLVLRPNGYVTPIVDWQYDTLINHEVLNWLDTQNDGWCSNTFNQRINLCGNVTYCTTNPPMGTYTNGFAVDVGFYWDGIDTGNLINAGGDNSNNFEIKLLGNTTTNNVLVKQGTTTQFSLTILPGKHLLSYYSSLTQLNVFIDGISLYQTNVSTPIILTTTQGPGFVLGSRMSEESPSGANSWLKFVPFFFHLRNTTTNVFSLTEVLSNQPSSILLLTNTTHNGQNWNSLVGSIQPYVTDNMQWVTNFSINCN